MTMTCDIMLYQLITFLSYALMHVRRGSLNKFWRLREVELTMSIKYADTCAGVSLLWAYVAM